MRDFDDVAPQIETRAETRAPIQRRAIAVIANAKSGTNARDRAALTAAVEALGEKRTQVYPWSPDKPMADTVARVLDDGADLVVSAGGDGTTGAVAAAMVGQPCDFAALPMGTFNYFARGLGLSERPAEAARQIVLGRARPITVGSVNGQVFLNNASLGVYPAILKQRESVYARWGRRRIMAHWSVAQTFMGFQRPLRLSLNADGARWSTRSPLVFVSRSAFQLDLFGLHGSAAISDDAFAVFVARAKSRADLFRVAWRLLRQQAVEGRDYDFFQAHRLTVDVGKGRALLAYDGEKHLGHNPFAFRMEDAPLRVVMPVEAPAR